MNDLSQYKISSSGLLSQKLKAINISDLYALSKWLKHLPYRRISDITQVSLVIDESCGTCSSKHILFSSVAIENGYEEFDLIVGVFKMNKENTPGIGDALKNNYLDYIPEAHCYIRCRNEVIDVTKPISIYESIKDDVLEETIMLPAEVISTKKLKHISYLNQWRLRDNIKLSVEDLWAIREECIHNLVNA